jgi:hypothetical protein
MALSDSFKQALSREPRDILGIICAADAAWGVGFESFLAGVLCLYPNASFADAYRNVVESKVPSFYEIISAVVSFEQERLYGDMAMAVAEHDEERLARYKLSDFGLRAKFQARVERTSRTVRTRWKEIKWRGSRNNRTRCDTYFPCQTKTALRTPVRAYRHLRPWEIELIERAEDRLEPLRHRAKLLGNISRLVTRAYGGTEQSIFDTDNDDTGEAFA